ncbi:MAG: hypothetical protein IPJ19_12595 [Planctomycetes bacterium]|nr:hypothetical protein [Planctomycetota bacterium]
MASPRKKTPASKQSSPAKRSSKPAATPRASAEPAEESEGNERRGTPRPDEMPPEVLEFIQAIDEYKRVHRRPFPTWSEVLEIVKTLGYERAS